jgi:hypothetical protein
MSKTGNAGAHGLAAHLDERRTIACQQGETHATSPSESLP